MAAPEPTPTKPSAPILTVVEDFDGYRRGEQITDPDEAAEAQKSHPHHVVRVPPQK